MSKRQRRLAVIGGCIVVAALTAWLVAWLGWDRANTYLGVPAALAALIGLALAIYPFVMSGPRSETEPAKTETEPGPGAGSERPPVAQQRARARRDATVIQVGAPNTVQRADASGRAKISQYGAASPGRERGGDGAR